MTLFAGSEQIVREGPLSIAQERFWFLEAVTPGAAAHAVVSALTLRGQLHLSALEPALVDVIARHEILRTTFEDHGGRPVQRVHAAAVAPLRVHRELRSRTDEMISSFAHEAVREPFDLRSGPLLRLDVHAWSDATHTLVLSMHHIICDGWSQTLFYAELADAYTLRVSQLSSTRLPLQKQYLDFAVWERTQQAENRWSSQLAHFREHLTGDLLPCELPALTPRPSLPSFDSRWVPVPTASRTLEELRRWSADRRATLFMALTTAFLGVLQRYTSRRGLVFGTPVVNRPDSDLDDVIGLFVNTLALRVDISGEPTFFELLGQVRTTCLSGFANQEVPFDAVVAELNPQRTPGSNPLFQVAVVAYVPFELPRFRNLDVNWERPATSCSVFDLSLVIDARAHETQLSIEYRVDLIDGDAAHAIARTLSGLLDALAARADTKDSLVELVMRAERRHVQPSVVQEPQSPPTTIHERFRRWVELTPDAIALRWEGESLTYSELDRRASAVARGLSIFGVRPETIVAIELPRGAELAIAIVAVLQVGGAYLPLDIEQPIVRREFMIATAGAKLLISSFADESDAKLRRTDIAELAEAGRDVVHSEFSTADAENLAYVIFTSGSTGKPKGVMVTQQNLIRLIDHTAGPLSLTAAETWTLFHSPGFDFSVWEFWGPLLTGATLVVVPDRVTKDADAYAELIAAEKVTVLNVTPSYFNVLMRREARRRGIMTRRDLRLVVFGGEELRPRELEAWAADWNSHAPRLVNMYGITETTVHVTLHELVGRELQRPVSPIGLPLSDMQIVARNADQRPAPPGAVGEMYVTGAGLARGYIGAPALTAERFTPNPDGTTPGERAYRSGDLARQLPDGRFLFHGRADSQLKIRGYRVELGEIEAVLAAHETIQRCLVSVRRNETGEQSLVAYVEPVEGQKVEVGVWRSFLRARLPEYMVPAQWIPIERFALTANGKIDRNQLPSVAHDHAMHEVVRAGGTADRVATLWKQLLHLPHLDFDTNFFDAGGHSLLLIEMQSRLSDDFGIHVRVADLLQYCSVCSLTEFIDRGRDSDSVVAGGVRGSKQRSAVLKRQRSDHQRERR